MVLLALALALALVADICVDGAGRELGVVLMDKVPLVDVSFDCLKEKWDQ